MNIGSFPVKETYRAYQNYEISPEKDITYRFQCSLIALASAIEVIYHVTLVIFCHFKRMQAEKHSLPRDVKYWHHWGRVYQEALNKNIFDILICGTSVIDPLWGFDHLEKAISHGYVKSGETCDVSLVQRNMKLLMKKVFGIAV